MEIEEKKLEEVLHKVLDQRSVIDKKIHKEDHDWVQEKRQRDALCALRREKVMTNLATWGITGALGTVLGLMLYAVQEYIRHIAGKGG